MKGYVVIDRLLFNKVAEGQVIPMLNDSILEEYEEVLMRPKFKLASKDVSEVCRLFDLRGIKYVPEIPGRNFIDPDDQIFYETYLMWKSPVRVTPEAQCR